MSSIKVPQRDIGEVITFYSYKGGTGRSMALSNVACILASSVKDKGVLMVDWDLEAPGLDKFFFHDRNLDPLEIEYTALLTEFNNKPGLIELFSEISNIINNSNFMEDEALAKHALDRINIKDFISRTPYPNLSILKAGRIDKKYSDKINTFSWENLYNKSRSLIPLFSDLLSRHYRYVLIDSRTGYTDISGICTMIMPQKLVVVFTPNRQSFGGTQELIRKATEYRIQSHDLRPLLVYPLASRIESSLSQLRADWRYGNNEQKIPGYQSIFEDLFKEVYELKKCNLHTYFDQILIQQSPDYAYGEQIAVIDEKEKGRFSLTGSYEVFTKWLVNSTLPWEPDKQQDVTSAIPESTSIRYACFISYPGSSQSGLIKDFATQLKQGLEDHLSPYMNKGIYMDIERLEPSSSIKEQIPTAICQSVCMIVIYTPIYEEVPHCLQEFLAMEKIERQRIQILEKTFGKHYRGKRMIIPIILRGVLDDLPDKIKETQYFDVSKYVLEANLNRSPSYTKTLDEIAVSINEIYKDLKQLESRGLGINCDSFEFPSEHEALENWKEQSSQPQPRTNSIS